MYYTAMLQKSLVALVTLTLLFVIFLGLPATVAGYGVASFNLSCTRLTLAGWTDDPLQNTVTGVRYVMGSVRNLTTGQNFTFSSDLSTTGNTYRENIRWALVHGFTVSPGDSLRFRMWDRHSDLMDMTGTCGMSSDGGVPTSFSLRTMTCTTPLLDAPAGLPLIGPDGTPYMIETGTNRHIKPGNGEIGSDGLRYTPVRASYSVYGYIRSSCVGGL
jgi:hypothetical protein